MSLFIESLRIDFGEIKLLQLHEQRLNKTRLECLGENDKLELGFLQKLAGQYKNAVYKCRIVYGRKIKNIEIINYEMRKIKSLHLVENNEINYWYKFENRSLLEQLFEQRQNADDVIIVKNGFITDSSYSNLVFFDGKKWVTPENSLLKGVQQQYLLQNNIITAENIPVSKLNCFTKVRLINAMMTFEIAPEIDICNID